jgi:uncharacterized membrane protein (DUF4010 family)
MDFELPPELPGLVAALGIGMLIGLERERRKEDDPHLPAGIRSFTLIALAGAVAQLLGTVAIAVSGAFVGLAAAAAFWRSSPDDPGVTTEVAMLVTWLLGVLAGSSPGLAAGLGVAVAVILAGKGRMHEFAQRMLTAQELRDLLLLAAAALIVLPLLPDDAPDPWGALNLRRLGTVVVLVMAINAAGYVALRAFGSRIGLAITGFTGGFVSSTATIGSMGSRAKATPKLRAQCVAAALMSNVATIILLAIIVGALSLPLLRALGPGLVAAGLTAVAVALVASWKSFRHAKDDADALPGRAFHLRDALVFALVVGVVLVLSAWLNARFGPRAFELGLAAAGLADTHAPAASAAQLVAAQRVDIETAKLGVLAAFSANSLSKVVVATIAGGPGFALRLAPGIVAINAAFAAMLLLFGAGG